MASVKRFFCDSWLSVWQLECF